MGAWTGKPCDKCGKKKGNRQLHEKYCYTCKLKVRKAARDAAHGKRIEEAYNITQADYEALYVFQGGRCAICWRATGKSKKLAVDHDHKTGSVRGLLCSSCNRGVLGHLRDDVLALERAIRYLQFPPYQRMLAGRST
jgi:hypothetical protein